MTSQALRGVRFLDLTRLLRGPVATLHLADLRADVINIEGPGLGAYARQLGPMWGDTRWCFSMAHRGRRGMTLDLQQPEGVEVFLRLARGTVVESEGGLPTACPIRMEAGEQCPEDPAPTRCAEDEPLLRTAGCAPGEIEALRQKGVI
jgi:crotonobetainyl-CoA:carnitine CoA-transferase CaiB-like acyl-CoA transferase